MKVRTSAPVAVAGVSTAALAAGALIGAPAAQAAATSTDYTCIAGDPANPLYSGTLPLSIDVAVLPSTAPAGFAVPPGLLGYAAELHVPKDAAGLLAMVGADGGGSDDFAIAFGSTRDVPAPFVLAEQSPQADGSVIFSGAGANDAFQTPVAGIHAVAMPTEFTLVATKQGQPAAPLACSSDAPSPLGDVVLAKQASTTVAKALKKNRVKVKVTNEHQAAGGVVPTGKVLVKKGKKAAGKSALDAKGIAKVKLSGLRAGRHKAVAVYKGDGFDTASKSTPVQVKIK